MKLHHTIIASILLVLSVLGLGAAIAARKYVLMTAAQPEPESRPELVGFAPAKRITIRKNSSAIGTILAPRSIHLRTEVTGTVQKIELISGQIVEPDQLLIKLDTSVEEAQLASAQASKQIAESTYKRTRQAADARALSELELEQAAAMLTQSQAEVARLEAVIRKKTLRAPFRARAGLFDVHTGQYLPEGTEITMLQGVDDFVHVDFMMSQQVADELGVGESVQLMVDPQPLTAKIIAIDSQADKVTRNIMARAILPGPPATLQPNDSVKVEIEFGAPVEVVSVPVAALRSSPSGAFVYMVEPDPNDGGKLKTRLQRVLPGKSMRSEVTILQGISPNDIVVSDGSFKLREGLWVADANSLKAP